MARKGLADSGAMTDDGQRIKERRERLGMNRKQLAALADVNRATLTAIEDGHGFRMESLTKIKRALDAAEQEAGVDVPPPREDDDARFVTFEVTLPDGGATVTVRGPVEDIDRLVESVRRLVTGADSD